MKKFLIIIATFFSIFPANAQWQSLYGPNQTSNYLGLDVMHLVINGKRICAATSNGIYLSIDNGTSWMYASYGLSNRYIRCIAYTGDKILAGTQGAGMYLSYNNGSSYKAINGNLPSNSYINAVAIINDTLIAAVDYTLDDQYKNEVLYSTDQGKNWITCAGSTYMFVKDFTVAGNVLYAGTQSKGIFKSVNNGVDWENIGLDSKNVSSIAVKGNYIFTGSDNSDAELHFSSDSGKNWTLITSNLPQINIMAIVMDSSNNVFLANSTHAVYKSGDLGTNWSMIFSSDLPIFNLGIRGNNIYVGCLNNGLAVSTNGGNTFSQGPRSYNIQVYSMLMHNLSLYAGTNYGVYNTEDKGKSWIDRLVSDKALTANDSVIFEGGDGGMEISKDNGKTWDWSSIRGLPEYPKISTLVANDFVAFAGTKGYGVFISKDGGINWSNFSSGLGNLTVNSLVISDSVVIAGTNGNGIFISNIDSADWIPSESGMEDTCVQTLARNLKNIYAGTKNKGIFKSLDLGKNWVHLNTGLVDSNVLCLYTYGENIFAGVKAQGVYMSPDNGNNWTPYNQDLINYNIKAFAENDTILFAGTDGDGFGGAGVWKRAMSDFPLTFSIKEIKSGRRVICEGDSTSLKVTAAAGIPPFHYLWSNGDTNQLIYVKPRQTKTYSATITDSELKSVSAEINIQVKPSPKPLIEVTGDILTSNYPTGNQWYLDNIKIYGATTQTYTAKQDGFYYVVVTENGCSSLNPPYVLAIQSNSEKSNQVFPNPVHDLLTVETDENYKGCTLVVSDNFGQVLIKQQLIDDKTGVDFSQLSSGVYSIKLITAKKTESFVVIKN